MHVYWAEYILVDPDSMQLYMLVVGLD
jgi:hypothetical protein